MIDETSAINTDVIAWLKAHGNPSPPPGPAWSIVDGYELHSHPELAEQLDSLPTDEQKVDKSFFQGFRVHSRVGIIFALAPAIWDVALRYPEDKLIGLEKPFRDAGKDWVLVKAFGNGFLKEYYDAAYRYASGLAPTRL